MFLFPTFCFDLTSFIVFNSLITLKPKKKFKNERNFMKTFFSHSVKKRLKLEIDLSILFKLLQFRI